jgi:uncharacterized protein involved in exopolysaccharide biosynthesis
MALPTQIELLRSRALAERVVDELNLDPSRSQAPAPGVLGGASAPASAPVPGAAPGRQRGRGRWALVVLPVRPEGPHGGRL